MVQCLTYLVSMEREIYWPHSHPQAKWIKFLYELQTKLHAELEVPTTWPHVSWGRYTIIQHLQSRIISSNLWRSTSLSDESLWEILFNLEFCRISSTIQLISWIVCIWIKKRMHPPKPFALCHSPTSEVSQVVYLRWPDTQNTRHVALNMEKPTCVL